MPVKEYEPTITPDESLIEALVKIDKEHYKEFGANADYFRRKFSTENARILVVLENGQPTGFCVFEVMEPNQPLEDFSNHSTPFPVEKWMHIIAFTTKTDFQDKDADKALLLTAEQTAYGLGCNTFCVPLTVEHPYPHAYPFFEGNGYQKAGTLDWIAGPNEFIH